MNGDRRKKENVVFVPDWRAGNPYMERLASGLAIQGISVDFDHYPSGFFKLTKLVQRHSGIDTIHLHWVGDLLRDIHWSAGVAKKAIKLVLLAADLMTCRARGIRIVWTVHNIVEHESPDPSTERRARALLYRRSSGVIFHSESALREALLFYGVKRSTKTHVIPHGNYLGLYPQASSESPPSWVNAVSPGDRVFLFFGGLRPYKGLDVLLTAFKSTVDPTLRLVIAGRPFTEEIERWIRAEAESDSRILLALGFVPDSNVAAHFTAADAVVLPFRKTLTSGSVILAMGFGKCLILPEEARVLDIPGDEGANYFTDARSLAEILGKLSKDEAVAKGAANFRLAEMLDWDQIAAATAGVYRSAK